MFCRELAAQVRGVTPDIEKKGARVVFIGNGTPFMAQAFKEDFGVTSALYTDPTLAVYEAAGMKRGMGSLWKTLKRAAGTLSEGHLQGRKATPSSRAGSSSSTARGTSCTRTSASTRAITLIFARSSRPSPPAPSRARRAPSASSRRRPPRLRQPGLARPRRRDVCRLEVCGSAQESNLPRTVLAAPHRF